MSFFNVPKAGRCRQSDFELVTVRGDVHSSSTFTTGSLDHPERQLHGYEMVYPTLECIIVGFRVRPLTVTQ